MLARAIFAAFAVFSLGVAPNAGAQTGEAQDQAAAVTGLARTVLDEITTTPSGDKDAVLEAINRATRGVDLAVITEAVCQLRDRRELPQIVGADPGGQARARLTLGRPEVSEALGETCEIARLALASSFGATGGLGSNGRGRAFGLATAAGSPGGGGGSGYVND
ncbi:hypothetical protein [Terricaulis silvestris]|uniref:Uncharacterized protein n=1 Tax=Terricaulis silvestris TaxID=2686094 RepID=A0A6I6MI85_9CAUL|nr:hypothetical protein [Terricaulis silvestris]QGZ93381.1 hypothetical protein DSM104635_00191 [Terricaulis silvestris]